VPNVAQYSLCDIAQACTGGVPHGTDNGCYKEAKGRQLKSSIFVLLQVFFRIFYIFFFCFLFKLIGCRLACYKSLNSQWLIVHPPLWQAVLGGILRLEASEAQT